MNKAWTLGSDKKVFISNLSVCAWSCTLHGGCWISCICEMSVRVGALERDAVVMGCALHLRQEFLVKGEAQ